MSITSGSGVSLVFQPESLVEPLDWTKLFANPRLVEVELGSGDGSFLAQWASAHPRTNFLGVERLMGRLNKLDRKGRRLGLTNLRLLRLEASYLIHYLIPPQSISALHVYFPDPWPKRKHRDRRLVNTDFTAHAANALAAQGIVWLRTDDTDYFEQMESVFAASSRFECIPTPLDLAAVITDFERDFNARGIPTLRAAYRRKIESP